MATCHSITYVNGHLIGDPLDVKMFESTKWELQESNLNKGLDDVILAVVTPPDNLKNIPQNPLEESKGEDSNYDSLDEADSSDSQKEYQISIIRRFDFSSKLQKMSVISKVSLTGKFRIYTKGSPERIKDLCLEESIPKNYEEILEKYTEEGYRVLGLATK